MSRCAGPEGWATQAQRKLREHGVLVLVLSRLVPAGRIPVMLACLFAATPPRRFARGDLPACLARAAAYELIGSLSGSLFREPWQGVAAASGLTVHLGAAPALGRRLTPARRRQPRRAGAGGANDTRGGAGDAATGGDPVAGGADGGPGGR